MAEETTTETTAVTDEKTLVPSEKYLKTGCHIGTKFTSGDMKKYIFKKRKDGLNVLDISTIDERIRLAAEFLSNFEPSRIAVVSRKLYGQTPAKKFCEETGARPFVGRFVPGTFSNPESTQFFEPKVLLCTEPDADEQAIKEATVIKIPVVALASTNNSLKGIDLAIPVNNKGRQSLALVYWLIAREMLKKSGELKDSAKFDEKLADFEYIVKEGEERDEDKQRGRRPFRRFGDRNSGGRSFGPRRF